jgi:hypothetical protein
LLNVREIGGQIRPNLAQILEQVGFSLPMSAAQRQTDATDKDCLDIEAEANGAVTFFVNWIPYLWQCDLLAKSRRA